MPDINETYHSIYGAILETQHVYIQNGVDYYCDKHLCSFLNLLEIGFGTGLNALLTCLYAERVKIKILYTTLEPYPLDKTIIKSLNFPCLLNDTDSAHEIYENLHQCTWGQKVDITSYFTLLKINTPLQNFLTDTTFHVIYFDAFAPSKQPDIWDIKNFEKLYSFMGKSAILVTYCAQGIFKRNLKKIGFRVTSLPGPRGKKEMTLAEK